MQKAAAQRLGKMDLVGTIPILAREGEHEGIFMSLLPDRVIDWLALNDITLPDAHLPPITRILAALEPIDRDRYYDSIWQLRIRRMVFGLIHSLSHAAMRAMTRYAGIDRTSVAEYIFLPLLGLETAIGPEINQLLWWRSTSEAGENGEDRLGPRILRCSSIHPKTNNRIGGSNR